MGAEEEIFGFADEFGPEKVVHFYQPRLGIKAILVVDNTALGPAIGGVRMAPDVTTREIFRLGRAMTLKNSIAGIPYGGGKAGIRGDADIGNKDEVIRAFAAMLAPHSDYIPGPDMGTDEHCMAIIQDQIGRAIGLHKELGGIPLDEVGVTGYGVVEAADMAAENLNRSLDGATVAIEGFGAVGQACFKSMVSKGATVVAVSDIHGGLYDADGLDYDALVMRNHQTGLPEKTWNREYHRGRAISDQELFALDVDVLIPGARPDVITMANVNSIRASLIVEGANIPASIEAEELLWSKGVTVVPDFVANAGGVIAGSVEMRRGTVEESFEAARTLIRKNVHEVLTLSVSEGLTPRAAAERIARSRVMTAMRDKGRL